MRLKFILLTAVVSFAAFDLRAGEQTGGRSEGLTPKPDVCAAAIQSTVAKEAVKQSWGQRHPRLRRSLQLTGIAIGALVVTGAPVYPGDYVGRSPLLGFYQNVVDASAYQGPKNSQQLAYFNESLKRWYEEQKPYLPPEIVKGFDFLAQPSDGLRSRTAATRALHYGILQQFQPIIFQDRVPTSKALPFRDTPIHPFAKLANGLDPMPAIFGHIRETETHYFAIYTLFYKENNFDGANVSGLQSISGGMIPPPTKYNHEYDLEVIVEAIRKEGMVREGTFTHRHGMMHPHSGDRKFQSHMRSQLTPMLSGNFVKGDKAAVTFGPFYQPNAIAHDSSGEFNVGAKDGKVLRGTMIFSARMGHATYPVSLDAWNNGRGNGTIFVPEMESFNLDRTDPIGAIVTGEISPMRLYDWDDFVEQYRGNSQVFTGQQDPFELKTSQGHIRARAGNPNHLMPSNPNEQPKTNVASGTRGRGPFPWAIPHANYQALTNGFLGLGPVSDQYIFNPDIDLEE